MSSLVIGFSGRARHGKTEACEAIIRHINYENLGTGLRKTVSLYDIGSMILRFCIATKRLPAGITRPELDKDQLQLLVDVGREKREENEEFWIGQMVRAIKQDAPDVALCPNLRYWNEAELLHGLGGYVVRYTRLNADGSVYISPDRDPNDISETALEKWAADFYITTKDGQEEFGRLQAVTLYRYLRSLKHGRTKPVS